MRQTNTPNLDLYVSWTDYHETIERLSANIYRSKWDFDQILCLARGGLRVGDILSRIYRVPLAILSASSYYGERSNIKGKVRFSQNISTSALPLGPKVLLVDDLVDSGETLAETVLWIESHHGITRESCRTAVLWYKACSIISPDYYVHFLPENPWIHQPFEHYESVLPEDLAQKFS